MENSKLREKKGKVIADSIKQLTIRTFAYQKFIDEVGFIMNNNDLSDKDKVYMTNELLTELKNNTDGKINS